MDFFNGVCEEERVWAEVELVVEGDEGAGAESAEGAGECRRV